MLKVVKAGACSTMQDAGRHGFQRYGVVVGGVMDSVAYRLGNALLGQSGEACIEMVLVGGTFMFSAESSIVLAGRAMQAQLNGRDVPLYKVLHVRSGDTLRCGAIEGRGYLCMAGGFQVEKVLGSRATYLAANIGGFEGRALQKGDVVPYVTTSARATRQVQAQSFYKAGPIRILLGTEWVRFSQETQQQFLQNSYTISVASNRVGYRLVPDEPIVAEPSQLISEAVTFGTIQMPASGEPIILMSDRQTTGGYLKIGQVISADLPRLAQLMPNEQLTFEVVTLEQAEQAFVKLEHSLRLMEALLKTNCS